ncbi:uncharacterized protein N7498_008741 [Penicillium cinerascens]|uniref:Uncharacterized protein n=1 Tax=Penicillium cinerascens TaxID=70096 RepID=A0A9W9JED1_9EURO|nr:uncharacterized protein N7498_008741 [Penicillium cinerascens]KAJ5195303.1 hypothetical protein N7498_008741 [Penicillium cinerascens]
MPSHLDGLKQELQEDEPFESAFINASEEQCKSWALEKQYEVNFIEQNIIGIADARTARDGTILMSRYKTDVPSEDFPEWGGPLPPQINTWYNWRIKPDGAPEVYISLVYGPPESVLPTYFARKEELTNEKGVFDTDKAGSYVMGKYPETGEKIPA